MDPAVERAWYVAYGSNLCRDRLDAYLEGTVAPSRRAGDGATGVGPRSARYGAHRGCADPSPPADDRWLDVAHPVSFRGRSTRWDGGVAFLGLVPRAGVVTEVRAWSLTLAQVLGIAGQEARLPDAPPATVVDGLAAPGDTAAIGGGWYDTLLRLDDVDGTMALTVTTGQDLAVCEPTEAYLDTIAAGRAERVREASSGTAGATVGGSTR